MRRLQKKLVGKTFGRLTVLQDSGKRRRNFVVWDCLCLCGNLALITTAELQSGKTKSCGCLRRENRKKHGDSWPRKRLYRIWSHMFERCNGENYQFYYRYGGRGIKVCEEWKDYSVFKAWALNNGYTDNLTIDRIDNDGNYEPSNCQWLTNRENAIKGGSRVIPEGLEKSDK